MKSKCRCDKTMKKKNKEEIIISEVCFRQQVNLPSSQVANLSDAELASALAFEIEPFSGIPHSQGEIAWRIKSDGGSTRKIFDVVQIRKTDFASILARAKSEKKKVKGVTARFDDSLGETLDEMPVICPAKKTIKFNKLTLWLLLCVVVFFSLAGEVMQIQSQNKILKAELGVREMLQAKKLSYEAKERSIRSEIEDIKTTREMEIKIQEKASSLRSSWRVLLDAISNACKDECVIRKIEKSDRPFAARLEGVALSPEAASRTMSRLTEKLKSEKNGWKLLPGEIGSANSGRAAIFTCEIIFDTKSGE